MQARLPACQAAHAVRACRQCTCTATAASASAASAAAACFARVPLLTSHTCWWCSLRPRGLAPGHCTVPHVTTQPLCTAAVEGEVHEQHTRPTRRRTEVSSSGGQARRLCRTRSLHVQMYTRMMTTRLINKPYPSSTASCKHTCCKQPTSPDPAVNIYRYLNRVQQHRCTEH